MMSLSGRSYPWQASGSLQTLQLCAHLPKPCARQVDFAHGSAPCQKRTRNATPRRPHQWVHGSLGMWHKWEMHPWLGRELSGVKVEGASSTGMPANHTRDYFLVRQHWLLAMQCDVLMQSLAKRCMQKRHNLP
jgi:hypothetical protein